MGRGTWLREGLDPLPPPAGDKAVDRWALASAGGPAILVDRRVLEIGPCYGVDAEEFAGIARPYVVVDIDELVIEWIRRFAPRAVGLVGDARALPFASGVFDVVLDFGSLDNVGQPLLGYAEASRVLAPGGVLVTTYGNAAVLGPGDGVSETYLRPFEVLEAFWAGGVEGVAGGNEENPRAFMVGRKR